MSYIDICKQFLSPDILENLLGINITMVKVLMHCVGNIMHDLSYVPSLPTWHGDIQYVYCPDDSNL
jgi:hypothetical protein